VSVDNFAWSNPLYYQSSLKEIQNLEIYLTSILYCLLA